MGCFSLAEIGMYRRGGEFVPVLRDLSGDCIDVSVGESCRELSGMGMSGKGGTVVVYH